MTALRSSIYALLAAIAAGGAPVRADGPVTLAEHIRPVLEKFCFDCHNEKKHKGDLNMVEFSGHAQLADHRKVWESIAEQIESGEMPPDKKPQPTDEQRELLLKFIDGQLSKADCKTDKNPGKVTIRRLNKEEYRNTIHDLLGVDYSTDEFPNDAVGYLSFIMIIIQLVPMAIKPDT